MPPTTSGERVAVAVAEGADRLEGALTRSLPHAGGHLFEKGSFQILYGFDGSTLRLVYDGNGDGRADVQTFYRPDGTPRLAEIDGDMDGLVDRWEYMGADGVLEKIGQARRRPGVPDMWEYPVHGGFIVRREYDDDGDGRVDRTETQTTGIQVKPEDTDGDGRPDRWITSRDGELIAEDVDTDGDARPDRRFVRGLGGAILRIEVDENEDGIFEKILMARPYVPDRADAKPPARPRAE